MRIPEQLILPLGYRQLEIPDDHKDYWKRLLIAIQEGYKDSARAINLNDRRFLYGPSTAKPTAAAKYRGIMYITEAASGAADTIEICLKSATDTYSWVNIATG